MFLTWKSLVIQVQEAQRVPYRINPKRNTPRHTAIKMEKIKENKLKAAREKQQRTPIRLWLTFSRNSTGQKIVPQYV